METAPNAEVYGAFTTRYLVLWTLSNIVWARVSLEQRLKQKARVKVLVTQSCPTLCDPMDCSLQGSSVHGILQARILEWVVMPFSRGSSWPRDQTHISCIAGGFFTTSSTWKKHDRGIQCLSLWSAESVTGPKLYNSCCEGSVILHKGSVLIY